MEWIQDCWLLVWDEETVENGFLIGCVFAGDGSIPRTPLLGVATPQTPAIKGIGAWFYFVVYSMVYEPSGRKDGL
ncbi:MAG: hypothetical protein PVF83_15905 [Anaerolineales bacterium]